MEEFGGMDNLGSQDRLPRRGEIVDAKVIVVDERGVWLSVGSTKYDAHLPAEEMTEELLEKLKNGELKEGDEVKVVVTGLSRDPKEGTTIVRVSQKELNRRALIEKLIEARNSGEIMKVKPTRVHPDRKGVFVDFGDDIVGFIPASELDTRFVPPERLDRYVGRNMKVKVLKVRPRRGDAILSAKAVLREEMERRKKEFFEKTKPGDIVRGRVVRVTDEDVIVELEKGVIGKVPFDELDWKPIKNPQSFVKRGDIVRAYVMDIDPETEEIKLSMKLAKPNPWERFAERNPIGTVVSGKVLKVTPKVLVIKVGNIVGIVPRSEMTWRKIFRPEDLYKRGDYVKAALKEIDVENQRAVFSIKDATPDPWENIEEHYPVGSIVEGKVKTIKDFGAFVEIGEGIEGLIPRRYLSWDTVENVEDVVKVGDEVKVKVIAIMPEERKISLSLRDTRPDPYKEYKKKHQKGSIVKGKVLDVNEDGLLLELAPEVKGFMNRSQVSLDKIDDIEAVFPVGSEIEGKVIRFDDRARLVHVSRKALEEEKMKEEMKEYAPEEEGSQGSFRLGELLSDLLNNNNEE